MCTCISFLDKQETLKSPDRPWKNNDRCVGASRLDMAFKDYKCDKKKGHAICERPVPGKSHSCYNSKLCTL